MTETLKHLVPPEVCRLFSGWHPCGQSAHWWVNGEALCDECVRGLADMNNDNEEFLRPALQEIAQRSGQSLPGEQAEGGKQ